MGGSIYLLQPDDKLVEMHEEGYLLEEHLQKLLEEHPALLAGELVNPSAPRRWLLIRREAGLADNAEGSDRWSLDHLFIDQDAVPTLIEVKRSSNTQIRREVVGQMLDYAANAVAYLPIEKIRSWFEERCTTQGVEPHAVMADAFGIEVDPEAFWADAKRNLQAGRIRLVFAADHIPRELERIIEFLNGQMDPAEVLGLEVPQFVGSGLKTLVPKVVGRTAGAERAKSSGGGGRRTWDEASFFVDLLARRGPEETDVARRLLDWARVRMPRISWGVGAQTGSFAPVLDHAGVPESVMIVYSAGYVQIPFGYMSNRPPFDDLGRREEFARRLVGAGFTMPADAVTKWPSIRFSQLQAPGVIDRLIAVLDWSVDVIRET